MQPPTAPVQPEQEAANSSDVDTAPCAQRGQDTTVHAVSAHLAQLLERKLGKRGMVP